MPEATIDLDCRQAWYRVRSVGHYGGAPDKTDSQTEGRIPYAYGWYQMLQYARGSAYRKDQDGLVHTENIAIARSEAARTRAAEKLTTNSYPGTADETLDRWADVMKISHFIEDTIHDLRLRCEGIYRTAIGPSRINIDSALESLLGDAFVRTWAIEGADLATPPAGTYWPVVNPGSATYDLGGGAWYSDRCILVVEVAWPDRLSLIQLIQLLDVHMYQLLDRMIPAWATFDWAMGLSDGGFHLDIDEMDFHGLVA